MTNNDILRRLRYTLSLNDAAVAHLFELGGQRAHLDEVDRWTRPDEDPAFEPLNDYALATFLNGLIVDRRGVTQNAPTETEERLSNNDILRKLKIAFKLRSNEVQSMFSLAGKRVGEHEVTALFRRPGTRQYRECNDQYLRWFLTGLQKSFAG